MWTISRLAEIEKKCVFNAAANVSCMIMLSAQKKTEIAISQQPEYRRIAAHHTHTQNIQEKCAHYAHISSE